MDTHKRQKYGLRQRDVAGGDPYWEIEYYARELPLGVDTIKTVAIVASRSAAEKVVDELNRVRREGIIEGMARFAWWQNGEQMVGSCGTTLAQAIKDLDERG